MKAGSAGLGPPVWSCSYRGSDAVDLFTSCTPPELPESPFLMSPKHSSTSMLVVLACP